MTETHFTPGPWRVQMMGHFSADLICNGTFMGLNGGSGAPDYLDADDREEWLANANLIAAAPDLSAALEALLNDVCEMKDVDLDVIYEGRNGSLSKAKTALKKARGQS